VAGAELFTEGDNIQEKANSAEQQIRIYANSEGKCSRWKRVGSEYCGKATYQAVDDPAACQNQLFRIKRNSHSGFYVAGSAAGSPFSLDIKLGIIEIFLH